MKEERDTLEQTCKWAIDSRINERITNDWTNDWMNEQTNEWSQLNLFVVVQ